MHHTHANLPAVQGARKQALDPAAQGAPKPAPNPAALDVLTMDLRSDKEGSTADAGGAAACLDPVTLHALDQLQRGLGDAPHALLEVQPRRKAVHVQAGVYGPAPAAFHSQQASWQPAQL